MIIKEFEPYKKEIQEKIINGLFDYVRFGKKITELDNMQFMHFYNIIYNFVQKHIGDELLKFHNEKIELITIECYEKIKELESLEFLDFFITFTERLNFIIFILSRIFLYISNYYLPVVPEKDNIRRYQQDDISEFSMDIYKKEFFDKLQYKLFKIIIELMINDERKDDTEYKIKIESIMKIIGYMDYIKPKIKKINAFSAIWVEQAKEQNENPKFYQIKWIKSLKAEIRNNYIKNFENKVEKVIKDNSTKEKIINEFQYLKEDLEKTINLGNNFIDIDINHIIYERIIKKYVEPIINIKEMLENKKIDEFSQIDQLFLIHSEGQMWMGKKLSEYIKERKTDFFKKETTPKDSRVFISELLNIKKEIHELLFSKEEFKNLENVAFSLLMNKDLYPKQLANYIDFNMRSGFKGKSEEYIEQTLNDIISIFKNINSKHVFKIESEKKLSDRLIKDLYLSINAEKNLISKLKQECGITYVNKMSQMINDLEINKSELEEYRMTTSNKSILNNIKFKVQVISQNVWNINKSDIFKIEIPPFMKFCIDDFENYYINKYKEKKLIWCLGLSKLEIQYLYLKEQKISISTLPQYLTLLFLEKHEQLSLEKISELLGCNVKIIIKDISGLIFNPSFNPKHEINKGIILADIKLENKEFKNTTIISINKEFNVNQHKFNSLPLISKKTELEIREINKEEEKSLKKYEDNIIQATLTRIMKSRIGKEINHEWLVNEASKQIYLFKVDPQQIKENIEKLIEKNIIKRNHASYEYIA